MSNETKVQLIALTAIRRRRVVRKGENGRPDKTEADDIAAGTLFDATVEEAKHLTGLQPPAARRATLDERARAAGKAVPTIKDDLETKTVDELKAIAAERKIAIPATANNPADIIAEIRKATQKAAA